MLAQRSRSAPSRLRILLSLSVSVAPCSTAVSIFFACSFHFDTQLLLTIRDIDDMCRARASPGHPPSRSISLLDLGPTKFFSRMRTQKPGGNVNSIAHDV
ncbi:uncharacterized protein C8R40DRAFT_848789 [Lentinula edodes]|uniref:uncharacterized protein n=1 Tax=Lentinula edodes TaxID=5353 RepID=UPI001E8E4019|nr:uncharacterized protein C8R40DRAFT_848789 [Lentinula edodes]KAH7868277.1 hypothetical protein C8R40DRAFT_848789 [Lentinula edodes]